MQNISGLRKDRELIETNIKVKEKSGNWKEIPQVREHISMLGSGSKLKDFFPFSFLFLLRKLLLNTPVAGGSRVFRKFGKWVASGKSLRTTAYLNPSMQIYVTIHLSL